MSMYPDFPKTRDHLIREAMSRGMTGFNIPGVSNGISDVLMNVDTFDKALTQRWLINLNAWRYRSTRNGILSTTPLGTNQTNAPLPDNQIQSISPRNQAVITFGAGGADEQVTVDYPPRGCTFTVTASSVRLQLINTGLSSGATFPSGNFSGFLCPSDVSRDSIIGPPTYTTGSQALNNPGAGGSVFFDIPPRAVGYRPMLPEIATYYNNGQNMYQTDGIGNRVKTDILNWGSTAAPTSIAASMLAGNEFSWYPLHPLATEIEINTVSTTQQFITLQFVLDLA